MNIDEQLLAAVHGTAAGIKGPGLLRTITGADPAAGSEVAAAAFTVPAGKQWKVLSFTVPLVQGITQTPAPALVWDDGTSVLGAAPGSSAPVSVSTTTRMTWIAKLRTAATAGAALAANIAPIPDDIILEAGHRLTTLTGGIGANTDYGVAKARVLEYTV